MKRLKWFLIFLVCVQGALAQNLEESRKVAELTFESFNSKTIEQLTPYLSEDFSMNGRGGDLSSMILGQMVSQFNDSVVVYVEETVRETDEGLELDYKFAFKEMGSTSATFRFNSSNLLQELDLHLFKFKSCCSSKIAVETPDANAIEIPFTLVGNLITVEVEVEGQLKTFLFDTGSSHIILNSQHAIARADITGNSENGSNGEPGIKAARVLGIQGVGGDISGMQTIAVGSLNFAGISINNQDLHQVDLSHLEERIEAEIFGILGYEMVRDYDILYDYDRKVITLIRPEHYEEFVLENMADKHPREVPIQLHAFIAVLEVEVNNQVLYMGIDCGSESNLINYELFASLEEITDSISVTNVVGADNNPLDMKIGKINEARIGDKTYKHLCTLFGDISHLNRSDKINIDGLIGYPVLSIQPTLVSHARKQVVFFD